MGEGPHNGVATSDRRPAARGEGVAKPDRRAVIDLLQEMGAAMREAGDHHRTRAYLGAANAIERTDAFESLYARGRLREIGGIGPSIEKRIVAFVERGERPEWLDDPSNVRSEIQLPTIPASFREGPFADAPDLHVHTTWSDGTLTLEETVLWAKALGASAIGITDHSGSLRIARGLRPDEVRAQWSAIAKLQEEHPDIRILRGTECDILRDGRLDHPDDILAEFDFVVASLHSQLKLPEREQTERVLAALDSPHMTIMGHPTTRVPGHRAPASLDLDAIFQKAAARGIAMEVNGNPGRIDLDAKLAKRALAAGCKLSLGSDGHSAREMLALAKARRIAEEAGAKEADIVNFDVLSRASSSSRRASRTPAEERPRARRG